MATVKILYIDDEEHNLQSFKATFRRLYSVRTAISAAEALRILEKEEIHIIISDHRMPEITGVQFFKQIQNKYPDPIRILLTGYTDMESLAEAINEGHIYRYLTKPWNELELNNSIINAYESYQNRVALKQKVEELQKTNDQLNRFIYSISHELRGPLASALGVIELAKMDNLIQPQTPEGEYWTMINDCCQKLDHNISKTLQYYRNIRYKVENEAIDFAKVIHGLVCNIDQQITVTTHINQPVPFYNDSYRVEMILSNLVSNAVKYQKPEEPDKRIDIRVEVSDPEALITIADNGVGIPAGDIDKIFTQFFRGRHHDGGGLGLFVAKEAIDKINGNIFVESDIDKGATFVVTFPNMNNSP